MKCIFFAALVALLFVAGAAAAQNQILLTAEEPGGMVAWYTTSGTLLGSVRVGFLPHEIIASPDGKTAWVSNFGLHDYSLTIGYAGYYISELDVVNMVERRKLYMFAPGAINGTVVRAPHGLKLSPDGKTLWVNTEFNAGGVMPALCRFDLTSTSQYPAYIMQLPAAYAKIHNFVYSPAGDALWLQLGVQGFARFDLATLTLSAPFAATGGPVQGGAASCAVRGLVFAPDGKMIISGAGELLQYDITTGVYPPPLTKRYYSSDWYVAQFLYANITPNNKLILVTSNNGQVFVIDYYTGALLQRVSVFGLDPVMCVPSADSKFGYATAARGGAVTKISLTDYSTIDFPTPVNAGPNGLVLVNQPVATNAARERFNAVVVLPLSQATLALPPGYWVKSTFELWKETANLQGGISLANGDNNAVEIFVTYVDDLNMVNNTNAGIVAALQSRNPLSLLFDADEVPHAIFVANPAWSGPNAAVQAQMQRILNRNVPVLSVYALAAQSSREVVDDEEPAPIVSRQLAGLAGLGHDRWVDTTNFNTEYYARFQRQAVFHDGQAITTALTLQEAMFNSGSYNGPSFLSAVGSVSETFFYSAVNMSPTTGLNQYNSFPVFVNPMVPAATTPHL